jgi:hypothetical protein
VAVVRRQKGDKTKVNANGVLVITRKNGNVIKVNGPKGTIVRKKADGTVVRQKLTKSPTATLRETGSAYGSKSKWNIESQRARMPGTNKKPSLKVKTPIKGMK